MVIQNSTQNGQDGLTISQIQEEYFKLPAAQLVARALTEATGMEWTVTDPECLDGNLWRRVTCKEYGKSLSSPCFDSQTDVKVGCAFKDCHRAVSCKRSDPNLETLMSGCYNYNMYTPREPIRETGRDLARDYLTGRKKSNWTKINIKDPNSLPNIGEPVLCRLPKSERRPVRELALYIMYESQDPFCGFWAHPRGVDTVPVVFNKAYCTHGSASGGRLGEYPVTHWRPMPEFHHDQQGVF